MSLLDYCKTEKERKIVKAFSEHGSNRKAGEAIGLPKSTVGDAIRRVKERASLRGYAPEHDMTKTTPETHIVKGTSTLYDESGNQRLQWVKTNVALENQVKIAEEAMKAFIEAVPSDFKSSEIKTGLRADIINTYITTDEHLGMLAWGEETGADWDIDIAKNLMLNWYSKAIEMSPDSHTAILASLGDGLHYDSMEAVTPAHGHILDADTRFQKLVRVYIDVFISIVEMLKKKHQHVHIIHAEGNHNPASSAWLREMFHRFYLNDEAVTVELSPDPYYCYEFGDTSLFFHHGHKRKVANMDSVFAAKFRDVFGRTKYSYAHAGHLHSKDVKETNLMIVEQHQTLAAPDAYASRGGWMSQRSAQVITYHKDYGEVGRVRITPEMCA